LALPEDLSPVIAKTMREHFDHFLTTEAKSSVASAQSNEGKGVSDDWQERGLAGSGAIA
jgi:hypothetical protein